MEASLRTGRSRSRRDQAFSHGELISAATASALFAALFSPAPIYAASGDLTSVIESIRTWVAGLLAALATLFLTVGGIRYLMASGNSRMMDEGKAAIRSALIGYALAALAPMLVDILRRVLAT